jgi:tRNA uridine 5-carbamoylmethylation protein Kti12
MILKNKGELMTLVINLFAGPGAGKSTTAAGLFYTMKKEGMSVELVTEYAKDRVWEEHSSVFEDQLYLLAKQNRRLKRLQGKVDYIVTDSPLLLGQYYASEEDRIAVKWITDWAFNKYNNLNIFLRRTKPYVSVGRNQNYEEALKADQGIKKIIETREYIELEDNDNLVRDLIDYLRIVYAKQKT